MSDTEVQDLFDVKVVSVRDVARDIKVYELARTDGRLLPSIGAGAHIDLHLPNGVLRQYSLTQAANEPDRYTVGIKRDANSRGGSRYIYDEMGTGVVLKIGVPRNNFPLVEDAPHSVLFAGGIGITPIWSMVQRLLALGRNWKLFYSCRSRQDAAFYPDLEPLGRTHFHFDDLAGGVLDIAAAVAQAPEETHFYCCGPGPMLSAFEAATSAIPKHRVHAEYFSAKPIEVAHNTFTIYCAKSKKHFVIPADRSIMDVLRDGGVRLSSSCEEGICGACETRVLSGVPDHCDSVLSDEEREGGKVMIICCSRAKTDNLVLDI